MVFRFFYEGGIDYRINEGEELPMESSTIDKINGNQAGINIGLYQHQNILDDEYNSELRSTIAHEVIESGVRIYWLNPRSDLTDLQKMMYGHNAAVLHELRMQDVYGTSDRYINNRSLFTDLSFKSDALTRIAIYGAPRHTYEWIMEQLKMDFKLTFNEQFSAMFKSTGDLRNEYVEEVMEGDYERER